MVLPWNHEKRRPNEYIGSHAIHPSRISSDTHQSHIVSKQATHRTPKLSIQKLDSVPLIISQKRVDRGGYLNVFPSVQDQWTEALLGGSESESWARLGWFGL